MRPVNKLLRQLKGLQHLMESSTHPVPEARQQLGLAAALLGSILAEHEAGNLNSECSILTTTRSDER